MLNFKYLAASALLVVSATPALASTVFVTTDPNAPISNFDNPTNTARAGYSLTLTDDGMSVLGSLFQTGGVSAGQFANLYFDLNPSVLDGSDLGFEIGANGVNAFIPGRNGSTPLNSSLFTVLAATPGTFNFSLANSLFTSAIAGLDYYPGQTFESNVTLRLSQSFGYSVAGGASYGANRLGTVNVGAVTGAVPEPATWAMMLLGFGFMGFALRNRRRPTVCVTYA